MRLLGLRFESIENSERGLEGLWWVTSKVVEEANIVRLEPDDASRLV